MYKNWIFLYHLVDDLKGTLDWMWVSMRRLSLEDASPCYLEYNTMEPLNPLSGVIRHIVPRFGTQAFETFSQPSLFHLC